MLNRKRNAQQKLQNKNKTLALAKKQNLFFENRTKFRKQGGAY